MVLVPTTYWRTSTEDFRARRVSTVIWANHLLRASIGAMQATARRLRADESLLAVEPQVAPLHEVFRLQGDAELAEAERRYLPARESLSAIVLAAGEGTDFGGLTARVPKAMLRVQGRPILARLLDDFAAFGGRNAVVVRGHRAEAVDVPGARFVDNPDFASTGEAFSLSLAEADLGPGTLVAFGDIVLKRHIIQALLEEAADGITLAVDSTLAGTADTDRILADRADTGRFSFDEVRLRAIGDAVAPAAEPRCLDRAHAPRPRWRRLARGGHSRGACRRQPPHRAPQRPARAACSPAGTPCGSSMVGAAGSMSTTSRAWSTRRASEAWRAETGPSCR